MIRLERLDLIRLKQVAHAFVSCLPLGISFGLVGTLGAGKTSFTRLVAQSAGVDPSEVTSPTFTLLKSYRGRIASGQLNLHHIDAYRVNDEDEFLELGVEECFEDDHAWTMVEWADRVENVMPENTLWMEFQVDDVMHYRSIQCWCSDETLMQKLENVVV